MNITNNTILITGGNSGIGRGLAEALHARGNTVIITGRRQATLDEVVTANPGMIAYPLDVQDPAGITALASTVTRAHPELNVLINNAGIMKAERVQHDADTRVAEDTISTNLLGPIRLIHAFLPHLLGRPNATIINTSSGLATVPLALTPTYSATKAAIHAYTEALRYQLRGTSVEVKELTPPYVATELMAGGTHDPHAMPLADFIQEVMAILTDQPDVPEICVDRVRPLRDAVANGQYATIFEGLNHAMQHLDS
ncbi:SDR family oxidoreductase [Deinococcus maricopensis]|uniref:Short-chain dehydrogenase/reductase SDR n=1 Tax=Deinococcus maricopensis (strain DSM 21211 / LMG 22137 / NRRL B-23946 / LB-34) TaxID=709986 RepID=E8U9T7_DEIML|nr:SDR family oxidoreductase [Deinococcus maricopensis]ADV67826.1 short-chain dehydrogenase/reductase SDR [Deinococcus maricopensis DSM 21211]